MPLPVPDRHTLTTPRHTTSYLTAGPSDGPLMIFVHGWPGLGALWHHQLDAFAAAGWRCVAPDMRGYGDSQVHAELSAYALEHIVDDLRELHDALGGQPAVWVGQDWGSPAVAALAAHEPARCRGLALISIPYLPRGFALANLVPLVDRTLYPAAEYPYGQWDYYRFYQEQFARAALDYEANLAGTFAAIYRAGSPAAVGQPSPNARVRASGGRFGAAHRAPDVAPDPAVLSPADHAALVAAFRRTGFRPADAWYVNDDANIAFCAGAHDGGRLALPVLYIGGAWDAICDVQHGTLAAPMRAQCADLHEVVLDGGHWLMLEQPAAVTGAITDWLRAHHLDSHAH